LKDEDETLNFCFYWNDDQTLKKWIKREKGWNNVEINRQVVIDNVIHFQDKKGNSGTLEFNANDSIVHLTFDDGINDGIELIAIDDEGKLVINSVDHKKLKNKIRNKVEKLFGNVATPADSTIATVPPPSKDDDKQFLHFINQLKNDLKIYDSDKDVNNNIQRIREEIRDILHHMEKMRILSSHIPSTDGNTKDIDKIEVYVNKCNSLIIPVNEISSLMSKNNENNDIDKCIENMQRLTKLMKSRDYRDLFNDKLNKFFEEYIEFLDQDINNGLSQVSKDEYNQIKINFKNYLKDWSKESNAKLHLNEILKSIETLIKKNSALEQHNKQWNPAILEMDKIKTDDVIVQLEAIRHKVVNVKQSGEKNDTVCSVILDSLDEHLNEMKGDVNTADKLVLSNYIFYYSHISDMLEHLNAEIPVNDMPNIVKDKLENTKNKLDKLTAIRDNPDLVEIHPAIPVHFIELSSKFYKWAMDLYVNGKFKEAFVMLDTCDNTIDYTIALYTENNFANLLRIITNYR